MKISTCEVLTCGSTVGVVEVDGKSVQINPHEMSLVVMSPDGRNQLASGFIPHSYHCVDIAVRPVRRPLERGK